MNLPKLPYEYVSKQVDLLYDKKIDPDDDDSISQHCEFIADFINACGWTEEAYIRAMMGFEPLDNKNLN